MGLRAEYATRPRELIATILRDDRRFLTVAAIHKELERRDARVSLSTVYRTLEHLQAKGDVTARVDEDGESSYMACAPAEHHHHAICNVCGKVEDVNCDAIDRFADLLRSMHGFQLEDHQMEFMGRCNSCR